MRIFIALKRKRQFWISRWLDHRIKPAPQSVLDHHNIFILPSKQGYLFALVTLAVFLGGVNYENSLILALSFYLAALMVISITHTYRNLSGLTISACQADSCFAGAQASLRVKIDSAKRQHTAIECGLENTKTAICSLHSHQQKIVQLNIPVQQRGWYRPGRLRVATVYPLGFIRAWTLLDLQACCLVYPQPVENRFYQNDNNSETHNDSNHASQRIGVEDFYGLSVYQPGDSLKQVHWKTLARGGELYTKKFVNHQEHQHWIQWSDFKTTDLEQRLSFMTYWVVQWSKSGLCFGMKFPGKTLAPGTGKLHEQRCLTALALYRFEDGQTAQRLKAGS